MVVLVDCNLIYRLVLVLRDGFKDQLISVLYRQYTVGVVGGAKSTVLRHNWIQIIRLENAALKKKKMNQEYKKQPQFKNVPPNHW